MHGEPNSGICQREDSFKVMFSIVYCVQEIILSLLICPLGILPLLDLLALVFLSFWIECALQLLSIVGFGYFVTGWFWICSDRIESKIAQSLTLEGPFGTCLGAFYYWVWRSDL